jgi:S-adenosyl methyltransferase
MTSDDAAGPGDGVTAGKTGPLPFDTSKAHHARVYDYLLGGKQAAQLLDFSQPVAVTLIAILHAIPDADDPHAIVATLMDAVPSGSYLPVSHMGSDLLPPQTQQEMSGIGSRMSPAAQASRARRPCGARWAASAAQAFDQPASVMSKQIRNYIAKEGHDS